MLVAFTGTDVAVVRLKAHEHITERESEGRVVTHLRPESYAEGMLLELSESASLFGETQVVVVDTPSESGDLFDALWKELGTLAESKTEFVLIEGKLLAPQKKLLQKHAARVEEFQHTADRPFNVFALADALVARDKKTLWMLLVSAWESGLSNEEIIGTLLWQIKMIRLAARTTSAGEAGQKPFVYDKAKRALAKYQSEEIDSLSRDLLSIYHDGHVGKKDMSIALEHWVLKI